MKQLSFVLSIDRSFAGNSSLKYNFMPPLFWSLSTRKGVLNLSVSNSHTGKLSSILVSEIIKISTFPLTWSESKSSLFLMEFMLIWAILILLGYNSQNCRKLLFSSESLEIGDLDLQSVLEILTELGSSMKSKFSTF